MEIRELLLPEFDEEIQKTRATLERVPEDKLDYKPHEKSMPLGKLASHLAQMPRFATSIVELPGLDLTETKWEPFVMESRPQLLAAFDKFAARARTAISGAGDDQWKKNWRFSAGGKTILEGPSWSVYRTMFVNHSIHHRAQLGVYLRLNDIAVPATYGPSADDRMGF